MPAVVDRVGDAGLLRGHGGGRGRRLLLATAREVLAADGADKLTMDGLAERAGLGKGTVFRRFGTRAGIFQALLDDEQPRDSAGGA